jgi:hypothetical protein
MVKLFSRGPTNPSTTTASATVPSQSERAKAAEIISHWWKKQIHFESTAKASSHFIAHVVSLDKAKNLTLSELEIHIKTPAIQAITRKLLEHIEVAKDLILPLRNNPPELGLYDEKIFLSAYLIASKSEKYLDAEDNDARDILFKANEMLSAFEALCQFMTETYIDKVPATDQIASPITPKTPSADHVFVNMQAKHADQLHQRMESNHRFRTEGGPFLEKFHHAQTAYYSMWIESCLQAAQAYIGEYLDIEIKRYTALPHPDPLDMDSYEEYAAKQYDLYIQIKKMGGMTCINLLEEKLRGFHDTFEEEKRTALLSTAFLYHEVAINPNFDLSHQVCEILPQRNIETVVDGLTQAPQEKIELLLDVVEDIFAHLKYLSTQLNKHITPPEAFYKVAMKDFFNAVGLYPTIYKLMSDLWEKIKPFIPAEKIQSAIPFQNALAAKVYDPEMNLDTMVKDCLYYLYNELTNINIKAQCHRIIKARSLGIEQIANYEKDQFKMTMKKHHLQLSNIYMLIDEMTKSPVSIRELCSSYASSHVAQYLCIHILEKPIFQLSTLPVTFDIDRARLMRWHEHHQNLFYTLGALSCLETIGAQHKIRFSEDELLQHKDTFLMHCQNLTKKNDMPAFSEQMSYLMIQALKEKGTSLNPIETRVLAKLIQDIYFGKHKAAEMIYKRLRDALSSYINRGRALQQTSLAKMYGLEAELSQLGQKMLPVLRLHIKVHQALYEELISDCLWCPLYELLKFHQPPQTVPPFFINQYQSICETHAYIHKLNFLLVGLKFIQDAADHEIIKPLKLDHLARVHGLITLLHDHSASKNQMEEKFQQLIAYLTETYDIYFDTQQMARSFDLAKTNQCAASDLFLNELEAHYSDGMFEPTQNFVMLKEFKAEVDQIGSKIKRIKTEIKKEHAYEREADPICAAIPMMRTGS